MWALLDEEGLSVDDDLKLILKAAKCDNMLLLASFGKDDKLKIEKFMSETLHKIIPKEKYEKYYGIYEDHPELFRLVAGHDKQLDLIAKLCKRLIAAAKSTANAATNATTISASDNSSARLQVQQKPVGSSNAAPRQQKESKILHQKDILDRIFNNHLKTTYEENMKVSCIVAEDGLQSFNAQVECPVCNKMKKIQTVGTR